MKFRFQRLHFKGNVGLLHIFLVVEIEISIVYGCMQWKTNGFNSFIFVCRSENFLPNTIKTSTFPASWFWTVLTYCKLFKDRPALLDSHNVLNKLHLFLTHSHNKNRLPRCFESPFCSHIIFHVPLLFHFFVSFFFFKILFSVTSFYQALYILTYNWTLRW